MNLIPPWAWLATLRRTVVRTDDEPDFGDMGTAIGLDACIEDDEGPAPLPTRAWSGRPRLELPRGR